MLKLLKRLFVKIFGLDKSLSDTNFLYGEEMNYETEEWNYRYNQDGFWDR